MVVTTIVAAVIGITFFIALIIALFYILQPAGVSGLMSITDILEIHTTLPLKPIKIFAGALFIFIALHIWYFIPLLIPLATKSRTGFVQNFKQVQDLYLFFVIILIVSSGIWAIIHPMHDSIQFHYLPTYLLLYILIFTLWSIAEKSIAENKKWIKVSFYIICISLIGLNFYQISGDVQSEGTDVNKVKIPHYQRPYSWDKDMVKKLIEDWHSQYETEYFAGSVVTVADREKQTHDLIDGQQRFTTIFLTNYVLFLLLSSACMQVLLIESL